ncbi:MAG: sortase [Patescibacteria group bacterium]
MNKHTRENFLYVGEELILRLGKPVFFFFLLLMVGVGIVWGFQKVDAHLTPSWTIEKNKAEITEAAIVIPKIGVEAPIIFVASTKPADFLNPLKNGVAHYPSILPGRKGTSIILGHSAPLAWFGSKYDDIFSNLKDLEHGDRILITRDGKLHIYEVKEKVFLNRGQDVPAELMQSDGARLLLLSCWPPGINNKRIIVQSEII